MKNNEYIGWKEWYVDDASSLSEEAKKGLSEAMFGALEETPGITALDFEHNVVDAESDKLLIRKWYVEGIDHKEETILSITDMMKRYLTEKAILDHVKSLPPVLHKHKFAIETTEAQRFWSSKHACNRAKAIIAFSVDADDALLNMRRIEGWRWNAHLRKRFLDKYRAYLNTPDMYDVPFTPMGIPWYECLSGEPDPSVTHVRWDDMLRWMDTDSWVETIIKEETL